MDKHAYHNRKCHHNRRLYENRKIAQQYGKEISLLKKGISLRNVSQLTGTSINTLRKLRQYA